MLKNEKKENVFALGLYKGILSHRLLTQEEENNLGTLAIQGNLKARNALVLHNQRLVVDFALRMHKANSKLDFDDLYIEGNIGLIKAAERFVGTKGARFATFASYYVKDSMQSYARKCSIESNHNAAVELEEESLPDSIGLVEIDFDRTLVLQELSNALGRLSQNEREVIVSNFGVFGRNKTTLEEIGKALGLTKQRVCQIEKTAIKKLRNCSKII